MRTFRSWTVATSLTMLASPANADQLKSSEILRHISGDWGDVLAPDFKPDANFCKLTAGRIWLESDDAFRYLIVYRDGKDRKIPILSGRIMSTVTAAETHEVVVMMLPPPPDPPAEVRIQMRNEDFAIVQFRDSPTIYMKRCPTEELTS